MIVLTGGLLILIACVSAGRYAAALLRERCRRLLDADAGLLALSRETGYLAVPLADGLATAAQEAGRAAALFQTAQDTLRRGDGISGGEAWMYALQQTAQLWTDNEAAALSAVAAGLGAADAETQKKHLVLARQRLAGCYRVAADAEARYGKLWRSMGWAGGAVLILLLI